MVDIIKFLVSIPAGFVLTYLLLRFLPGEKVLLGHDRGRKFAEGSSVNIGKPTGVGFYFVLVFALVSLATVTLTLKFALTVALIVICMIFGFLDDRSAAPWGEYIKGFLDFVVAIAGGILLAKTCAVISLTGNCISVNRYLYAVLAVLLIVASINATNATDGVDGLSGTLTILTLATLTSAAAINKTLTLTKAQPAVIMIAVLLAYLIFNHYPSKMLMGDAGSRAIGFFIAFYAISLNIPFAYLIVGLPFLLDGGISIVKITVGRLTHKKIILFKNITTPIHDHLKKRLGYTVPKTWTTIVCAASIIDVVYLAVLALINLL